MKEENEEDLKEELIWEWKKFKYKLPQLKSKIPVHVLNPEKNLTSSTPAEWLLNHLLLMRHLYQHFYPHLVQIAVFRYQFLMPGPKEEHRL